MQFFIGWVILSGALLAFTLSRDHPYRFTRFLAFECLLSLAFLNASKWFLALAHLYEDDPDKALPLLNELASSQSSYSKSASEVLEDLN